MVLASLPIAALLSSKVLALVNSQMQALLPPPAAQMHKLWMKVRFLAGQHLKVFCVFAFWSVLVPLPSTVNSQMQALLPPPAAQMHKL
jgi:hypothetical protein